MIIKPIFCHFFLKLPDFLHISVIFYFHKFCFKESHLLLSGGCNSLLNTQAILINMSNNFLLHGLIFIHFLRESLIEDTNGFLLLKDSLVESLIISLQSFSLSA